MDTLLTTSNVTFVLGVLAILFTVYNYFKDPQVKSSNAIEDLQIEIVRLNNAFTAHVASDQVALSQLNQHVVEVDKSVVRLTTIIDERIPKNLK